MDCGEVNIANAFAVEYRKAFGTFFTDLAYVSCQEGYSGNGFTGKGLVICLADGKWSNFTCQGMFKMNRFPSVVPLWPFENFQHSSKEHLL